MSERTFRTLLLASLLLAESVAVFCVFYMIHGGFKL